MDESGGLSRAEFLVLQEQLIALRNRNYELQESLQKKNQEIATLMSPKSEALQFATKLMNRREKEKELAQKYETQLDALRMKLTTQEEEFRLQQETLLSELNKVVCQNEDMHKELQQSRAAGSFCPQEGLSSELDLSLSEGGSIENASLQRVSCDNQTCESEGKADIVAKLEQAELNLLEKETLVSALEHKDKVDELTHAVEGSRLDNGRFSSLIQEQQEQIARLKEELQLSNHKRIMCENVSDSQSLFDRDLLEKEISSIMDRISLNEEEVRKLTSEKEAESLLRKLHSLKENHENEVQVLKNESAILCDEELEDRLERFESEREEMRQKIVSLESSLSAKEEDKALSLKKQAAVIKELQRAIREEKKRADSMERFGRCSYEEKEWHLVDEMDAKSAQTLDGVGSRSVSSASALESDNVELINRLTSLQKTHADTLDKVSTLESENARLCREIEEKSEIIEHWIRKKPLKFGTGFESPRKSEGTEEEFVRCNYVNAD
ncbi:unnamed protein product [Angiostrongylus costaricensis]|uniref:GRIP domain-containing protein n=1 Tax=Angiostrongylus costaricensis TaxID=334426 RepID=A0A0R3P9T1_ANGCS|nr:unnamed protein product [Angiostrongylus costaricensis]